jgi:hypothetical protein
VTTDGQDLWVRSEAGAGVVVQASP